jgi:membrane protein YdbS with pleckstrin-like domain
MICPKCKITIDEDSVFCKHCGVPLAPNAEAKPAPAGTADAPAPSTRAAPGGQPADIYRDPKCEQEVWQGRPAWRSYYGLWALWGVVGAIILGTTYQHAATNSVFVWAAWIVVLGSGLALLIRAALFVLSSYYRLTTQRLFIRQGILSRTTDQMELIRIDDVRVKQGLIGRLVNTGDIEVLSSDQTDQALLLESISAPNELTEQLRLHVRGARGKGTLFVEEV